MPIRVIPSHAAIPLANASVAAEGKEIRFIGTSVTCFYYSRAIKIRGTIIYLNR